MNEGRKEGRKKGRKEGLGEVCYIKERMTRIRTVLRGRKIKYIVVESAKRRDIRGWRRRRREKCRCRCERKVIN